MTQYHPRSAKKIGNLILSSWKSEQVWRSSFIGYDAQLCMSEGVFPSPDRTFRDLTKQTRILLEFKPYTESKRGILTGLGQCIAYLNKSHASILVAPSKIKEDSGEDFDMGAYLEKTFKKFIYGKLPIALFTFDGENLDNLALEHIGVEGENGNEGGGLETGQMDSMDIVLPGKASNDAGKIDSAKVMQGVMDIVHSVSPTANSQYERDAFANDDANNKARNEKNINKQLIKELNNQLNIIEVNSTQDDRFGKELENVLNVENVVMDDIVQHMKTKR